MKSSKTSVQSPPPLNSWHLAQTPLETAVTEFEWALIRWSEAYGRYQQEALSRLKESNLSTEEALILHVIRMQDRPKTAAMVAMLLSRNDIQNVQYSLRKLVSEKLIKKVKDGQGKSFNLTVTERGKFLTEDLAAIRRRFLVDPFETLENGETSLLEAAKMVNTMSGFCNASFAAFHETELLNYCPVKTRIDSIGCKGSRRKFCARCPERLASKQPPQEE